MITPPLWKNAISSEQTWVSWKNIKPELDNICSLFCYYVSSVGKVCCPSFKKKPRRSLSGFQKCFALSLVKIDPMVLEKKKKIWKKFMKTTKTSQQRRTTVKCSVELGSGELKTINTTKRCVQFKNHCNYYIF